MLPFAEYCAKVQQHVQGAYSIRVVTLDVPDPLTGDLDGAEIHIDFAVTPEQRLFLGWGQIWCSKVRPERERQLALTDPHSPSKYRINGVVVNMPEFAHAFSCKAGQPMANPPEKVCKVW